MRRFKHIVIGFGKGGKTLSAILAAAGEDVALVERSAMMYGGACPNAVSYTHLDVYKRQIHRLAKPSK